MEHWQRAEKSRAELGHKGDHDGLAFNFVNHAAIFYASDSGTCGVKHKSGPQSLLTRGKKFDTEIYFVLWGVLFLQCH